MMSKAQAKFNLKFDSPKKPGDDLPTLPEELDVLSDGELMSQYSTMVSWVNYAKSELVQAEIIEENALSALKHTEAMALPGVARLHHLCCADLVARLCAHQGRAPQDDPRWHAEIAAAEAAD